MMLRRAVLLCGLLLISCGGDVAETVPIERPERASLRAYHGAPPIIPHEVVSRKRCMACHAPGQQVAGRVVAPVTPHPEWRECNQCHVPRQTDEVFAGNGLEGLAEPERTVMASPFLPPYIPHRLDNDREASCTK